MTGRISIPGSRELLFDERGQVNRNWRKFFEQISGVGASEGDVLTVGSNGPTFGDGTSSGLVTLATDQTITGQKDFTDPPTINGEVVWEQSNIGDQINALLEDLAPDSAADFTIIYDATDGSAKKVLIDNFPGSGGSSAWGGITGTLSDQTDLQARLDDIELMNHWLG